MKSKLLKRSLMLLPVLALLFVLPVAASYSDTGGHWGEAAIDEWSQNGIVQGSDGFFRPDDPITRAEMATILSRFLKLEEAAENTYTDLPAGAWYEKAVLTCVKAGIMQGDGGGIIRPKDNITRQEAIVMLGRAWHISESTSGNLDRFTDGAKTADWAKGYVKSFVDMGYVQGVGNNELQPLGNINRASVVTILSNAVAVYAKTDGEQITMDANNKGIILVAAKNVCLAGNAGGMVLIVPGAAGSEIILKGIAGNVNVAADNVTVNVDSGAVLTLNFLASNAKLIRGAGAAVTNITGEYTDASNAPVTPDNDYTTPEIPIKPSGSGLIDGAWSPIF